MALFLEYHALAHDFLQRAATYEASGQPHEALRHYGKGTEVIVEALQLPLPPEAASDLRQNIRQLREWQAGALQQQSLLRKKAAATGKASTATGAGGAAARPVAATPTPMPTPTPTDQYRRAIEEEIVDRSPGVRWADIAGLELAKRTLQEMVILPALRADLFTGLRQPARGVLLFGPPGTGKTMLAKAAASEAQCTFFSVSAATLTSKWVGDSEKLVRALFETAAARQPAIIFLDEMDSVLGARSASEHEASRRLKTEFLLRFDGLAGVAPRVFVLGATNRPQDLDDAVRRRMEKRVYLPLPSTAARAALLRHLLQKTKTRHKLATEELDAVVAATEGYSGSDLHALAREAAMEPLRELGPSLKTTPAEKVRPVGVSDFRAALRAVRPSVAKRDLQALEEWNKEFGTAS